MYGEWARSTVLDPTFSLFEITPTGGICAETVRNDPQVEHASGVS
jgi:hypothetical protein